MDSAPTFVDENGVPLECPLCGGKLSNTGPGYGFCGNCRIELRDNKKEEEDG